MYASEYAHDEQPNFSIGNLYFGLVMYIKVTKKPNGSKVSFTITHLIITYTTNYKPNTILMYINFKNYDKINNYNVLKIYVNGCINEKYS